MAPKFAEHAQSVTVFMRNQTYIGPQIGSSVLNKEADEDAMDPQAAREHRYTDKEKERFRQETEYHLNYRREIERAAISGFLAFFRGSEANLQSKAVM
ncbi:hypothetical protein PV04_04393 [Phialophora macrospora]|uniref:Uncharacterized protein n=1 Tax=Phialophora macrospora TaxID=1851006 RepID=A0A0D2FPE1_9EURO|nr:hypothetical protein PV04_04393 [Phialophora macrospora]